MKNIDNINIEQGSNIFLIGAFILFIYNILIKTGVIIYNVNSITSIILEVSFFLLPSLLYLIVTKKNLKKILRINKINIITIVIIFLIMIFSLPIIGIINYLIMYIQSLIGRPLPYNLPMIGSREEFLLGIIVLALTPAICEEVMCRGVLMRAFEKRGKVGMIIISAGLFAVLHRNIQTFASIFFLGIIIGYITYRTNSIFGGIIAHFSNNTIALNVSYFTGVQGQTNVSFESINLIENMGKDGIFFFLIFVIIFILIFLGLILILRRNTEKTVKEIVINTTKEKEDFSSYIPLIIGLILISYEYVYQVLYILNIDIL
jgi:membrane protease YdiL (CAAX protease family)